jgi:hypothetical protein
VNVAVGDPTVKQGPKSLASLLTTVAISLGCNNLGQFEVSGVGLQGNNLKTVYQNYSIQGCLIVMVISLVLFFLIGLWLDNILPSAYGLRKSFCFCCLPSFWCNAGSRRKYRETARKGSKIDAENGLEDETYFEAKYMDRKNYEPVAKDLQRLEHDKKVLRVQDLRKTFENGFKAVNGVNVKMYNG